MCDMSSPVDAINNNKSIVFPMILDFYRNEASGYFTHKNLNILRTTRAFKMK